MHNQGLNQQTWQRPGVLSSAQTRQTTNTFCSLGSTNELTLLFRFRSHTTICDHKRETSREVTEDVYLYGFFLVYFV